ncbi:FG-GAP-like repeat-containing protein [Streptomyces sp. VRA16 Mangrove soil]|uniref:FG-GAP-like repeat-containing protein n=1 Tax=Streptomyces sp. VRA16 Mangrove soil TaxID=2817434 RepID=UPI001AA0065D|nr:FG-GAP-like repeat-containing protein [Streptomyces sp. VRA16 Mangrove soil]MBO1336432.1 VCBS repeat-containing protein [Streptomyces sp. VRA16 Mangrove soil]
MDRRLFRRLPGRRASGAIAACVAAALGAGVLVPLLVDDAAPARDAHGTAKATVGEQAAQTKARTTGRRVEVTALRTESTTTYAKPDGSFQLEASAAPFRAKVDGEWRPLDSTLRRTAHGWAPKAAADPVVFSAGGGRATRTVRQASSGPAGQGGGARPAVFALPATTGSEARQIDDGTPEFTDLVTLTSAGHEITLSWPGTLPTPVIDGERALYRDVLPDVDLLLTARDSGFSHVLIVHTAEAGHSEALHTLSYGLSSPDLTFHLDATTKAVTAQDESGAEIAVSPTPYLWDSAGEPAVTQGGDPQPAEPSEEPAPQATDESAPPHDGAGETPDAPSDADDTDAPDADPASVRTSGSAAAPARQAAWHTAADRLTDAQVLALPGLAGPDGGTHTATADADLSAPGTGDTTLTVTPGSKLTDAASTAYPLFIDPSFYGHTTNWTTAYKKYPSSSFYDGANYNTGTTEARVGYEADTWGTSRSFFRLDLENIKGAKVTSASVRVLETYSWSCSGRVVELWQTGSISSKTTWNNQPDWKTELDSHDIAHGYNSSCPDAYVSFNAKGLAQDAADGGWGSTTIGLRAYDETSTYAWKKFKAEGSSAPRLSVNYYRKPAVPSSLDMSPGPTCSRTEPYPRIGKRDLVLSAHSSDADGDLDHLNFELWHTGYQDSTTLKKTGTTTSGGNASVTYSSSSLTNGWTYSWQVQAEDETDAVSDWAPLNKSGYDPTCRFVYDSSFPNSPVVTSADYPEESENGDVWSAKKFGESGSFTFAPDSDTDVTAFGYALNSSSCSSTLTVAAGKTGTVSVTPKLAGPNVLYVCAKDSAGNMSAPTAYVFYVTPRDAADRPGDVTGDAIPDVYAIDSDGNLRMYPSSATGDLHRSLSAAEQDGELLINSPGGSDEPLAAGYWKGADGKPALLAHSGDLMPGDGISDLLARMPDGKLYVYRGDGYGGTDIDRRLDVRLPANAPDPATFDQVILGDYDLDGRMDLFATTAGGGLWAFTGYTGAAFSSASQIATTAWLDRDLVTVGDINLDGTPDLLFRSESDNLRLRLGAPATTGGATLASLSTSADSLGGTDATYATGWTTTAYPMAFLHGTPDVNNDKIPDLWAMAADGSIKFYAGGKTALGAGTTVISADSKWNTSKLSFG